MSADRVLGSDAARAVGRFRADGPFGYRAATMPDAPTRATRAEAEADEAAWVAGPPIVQRACDLCRRYEPDHEPTCLRVTRPVVSSRPAQEDAEQ